MALSMFQKFHKRILSKAPDVSLSDTVFVDITNAAEYFYSYLEQEVWSWINDFPSIVPPFPSMWLEFKMPYYSNREGIMIEQSSPTFPFSYGMMTSCLEIPEHRNVDVIREDLQYHFIRQMYGHIPIWHDGFADKARRKEIINRVIEKGFQAKWFANYTVAIAVHKKIQYLISAHLYLDKNGQPEPELLALLPNAKFTIALQQEGGDTDGGGALLPFFYALSLLHCKNVELVTRKVPIKVRKKRQRRGLPDVVFKQLVVNPLRSQKKSEGSEDKETSDYKYQKNRLHICRGHFKDYRDGPGLFGKYQDIYWWDAHVRGDDSIGVLHKTYLVSPKEEVNDRSRKC